VRSCHVWYLLAAAAIALSGCVVYQTPSGYYVQSYQTTYDRAWSAATGAMQDAGMQIVSSDYAAGIARGAKDGIDATVSVARQADGTTRVQFDAKSSERDPGLAQRFSTAYERRMGR